MSDAGSQEGFLQARSSNQKSFGFSALLAGALILSLAATARAANIVVDTLASGSVAGNCTLDDAVNAATRPAPVTPRSQSGQSRSPIE